MQKITLAAIEAGKNMQAAQAAVAKVLNPVHLSPAGQMAVIANNNPRWRNWYGGTVPHATKVANRRRNKAARAARRVHRR